jgi:hypothetical protein
MGFNDPNGANYSIKDLSLQMGVLKKAWYVNGEVNIRSYQTEYVNDGDISIALNFMGNVIPLRYEKFKLFTGVGLGYGNLLENSYKTSNYMPTVGLFLNFKLQGHYQIHKNLYGSARVQFTSYRCATAGVGLSWLFPYKSKAVTKISKSKGE